MYKIEQCIESTYDYQLRKIVWAKSELEKEGKPSVPWIVLRKAGITRDMNKFRHLFIS
jgi:hypothetical protein